MKQIEREIKGAEADATDDEVSWCEPLIILNLIILGKHSPTYLY
jgi:hypothetical protein